MRGAERPRRECGVNSEQRGEFLEGRLCRPETVEKVAVPLFRVGLHESFVSISCEIVGEAFARSVISEVHAPGNDGIQFYSVAFGRRNSLQEGFFDKLRAALPPLKRKFCRDNTPLGRGVFIIDRKGRFVKGRSLDLYMELFWGGEESCSGEIPSSRRAPATASAAWGEEPGESRHGNS